jgi:hypothetical protein
MHICGLTLLHQMATRLPEKSKEVVAKRMTPQDISNAQALAGACVHKNYKDC